MEQKIKEKYKVLFYRQDVDDKIQIRYWLSSGFDPEFSKLTPEINPVVEPLLIDVLSEGDKVFVKDGKYSPIKFDGSKSATRIPPCMEGKKVVEVVVDKTATPKTFVRNVWHKCNCSRFSLNNYEIKKPTEMTVLERAEKLKWKDHLQTKPFADKLNKTVDKIVGCMFNIDHSAIAEEVNKNK